MRLEGIAMEAVGALNGAFSFVTNRTCTLLDHSSPFPPSVSIAIFYAEDSPENFRAMKRKGGARRGKGFRDIC